MLVLPPPHLPFLTHSPSRPRLTPQSWCACNSNTNCSLGALNASCDSHTIVEEYRAVPSNGRFNLSLRLRPRRVRRLLAFGRPFVNHNGGHIFFGK